jgi:hypothetical protein
MDARSIIAAATEFEQVRTAPSPKTKWAMHVSRLEWFGLGSLHGHEPYRVGFQSASPVRAAPLLVAAIILQNTSAEDVHDTGN